MIIKIKSFKKPDFRKLLQYMLDEKKCLFTSQEQSFLITHNLKGNSILQWEKQYINNEIKRLRQRRNSTILTHEILSWHRNDSNELSLEKLKIMAREYIRQRNSNGLYVIVPHFDKEHIHLHVCASGIEYGSGKSLRLSKEAFGKLKKCIQSFQKENFPELSNSLVQHGKNADHKIADKEYQLKLRTNRQTIKDNLIAIINECYKRARSKNEFCTLLNKYNLKTYFRNGKVEGVIQNNYKFRFNRLGMSKDWFKEFDRNEIRSKELKPNRKHFRNRNLER
jgi:hypothetical protein